MHRSSQKRTILRILSRLNIGGPSIHARILFGAFNDAEYETHLVTGRCSRHEGNMQYLFDSHLANIHYVDRLQREIDPFKDICALMAIIKLILRLRPDIVHTHMAKAGALGRVAALLCSLVLKKKITLIHTYHGNVLAGYFGIIKSNLFGLIERVLAIFTDRLIAISKIQKQDLTQRYAIAKPAKVDIIKLGFDLGPFLDCQTFKGRYRKQLDVGTDTLMVGIVGRLVPIKNHRLFLEAARIFRERHPSVPVMFAIVGDGELRPLLEGHAAKIGLAGNVAFSGWEKNVPLIYADLDMVVLTSDNEGTPVSLIEAMAAKVPVISTGVGGVPDLLGRSEMPRHPSDGFDICERGIMGPGGDPQILANAIGHLARAIRSGEQIAQVKRAHDYVMHQYTQTRLVERVGRLYRSLVND